METESGFEIDGIVYEVPTLGSFNMDEAQVLYDYSGLALEDFLSPPTEASGEENAEGEADREQKLKNPGVLRALMHISYQRGNPDVKAAKISALISKENVLAALIAFSKTAQEGEEVPPVSTTEQEPSSPKGSVVSSTSSGQNSANGSDEQVAPLARIGAGR